MKRRRPSVRLAWNGGANGWASFLVGLDWRVNGFGKTRRERLAEVMAGRWFLCILLGLWSLTIQGPNYGRAR